MRRCLGDPSSLWQGKYRQMDTHVGFPGGSVRVHLPMQELQVQSLGQENPLEEGMVTHSSILAWRIPWTVWQATVHGEREEGQMNEKVPRGPQLSLAEKI